MYSILYIDRKACIDPNSIIHILPKAVVSFTCCTDLELQLCCKEMLWNWKINIAHNKLSPDSLVTGKISSRTHGIS